MSQKLFGSLIGGLQNVLDLRQKQHALTASNLANTETPGYKAKYINFENLLTDAVNNGASTTSLQMNNSRHLQGTKTVENPAIEELEAVDWAEDRNSVYSERETARLNTNQLMYTSVSRGLSKRLAILKFAAGNGR